MKKEKERAYDWSGYVGLASSTNGLRPASRWAITTIQPRCTIGVGWTWL